MGRQVKKQMLSTQLVFQQNDHAHNLLKMAHPDLALTGSLTAPPGMRLCLPVCRPQAAEGGGGGSRCASERRQRSRTRHVRLLGGGCRAGFRYRA